MQPDTGTRSGPNPKFLPDDDDHVDSDAIDAVDAIGTDRERPAELWPQGSAEGLRDRWQTLQLRFVDDPGAVAGEARTLVAEAVTSLTTVLADRLKDLDQWDADGADTERARVAVRHYREFFEALLSR